MQRVFDLKIKKRYPVFFEIFKIEDKMLVSAVVSWVDGVSDR